MPNNDESQNEQFKALEDLEKILGKPIPFVEKFNDRTRFGAFINKNDKILALALCKCNLTHIPKSVMKLKDLIVLNLSDNLLISLPESIENLKLLRDLDLHYNKLSTLPNTIGNLSDLKRLDLWRNDLTTLPDSIGNLKMLDFFHLSENRISTLPESFANLKSLKSIDIDTNNLLNLPESIGNLNQIQYINLNYNFITELPESIGQLDQMYSLDLRGNRLSRLPNSIGKLKSLKDLILESNQLTSLPTSITNLELLETLDLQYNQFRTLPSFLWKCKNLKALWLFENPWEGEWEGVEQFTTISVLEICRQRHPINIYLNYSERDMNEYKILDFKKILQQQLEIFELYEKGEIVKCQLMLFLATKNSITDNKCLHDLVLAINNDIGVIPIKGEDLDWNHLSQIDLTSQNLGYFDLSDKLGFELNNKDNIEEFSSKLYEYVKQYKRNYNLFETEERKLDIQKENIKNVISTVINSEIFKQNLKENVKELKELLEKLELEQISSAEFYYKCSQLLSRRI